MRAALALLIGLGAAGCAGEEGDSGGGDAPERHARAEASCAPDDGAAVELAVGLAAADCAADWLDAGDALHILVFGADPAAGVVYDLADGFGFAWGTVDGQPIDAVRAGTLRIDAWDEGAAGFAGAYALSVEVGGAARQLRGAVAGPWCGGDPMCG
jgi:hypothetical protein